MCNYPTLIQGTTHKDDRGQLFFNNDWSLQKVKRMYCISPKDTSVIRAWQGHKKEAKWFYSCQNDFIIKTIKIDNWELPSQDLISTSYIVSSNKNEVLYVPPGYVTGIKSIKPNSKLMVFSDATLEESINDDFRFDLEYWENVKF